MAQPTQLHERAPPAGRPQPQDCAILLQPQSHPELGEIRIDDPLFAIGRTEAPFASYPADVVCDLSRRHARIFVEGGAAYIADLDSKNGTAVNGQSIQQKITRLRDGDAICLADRLGYHVRLRPEVAATTASHAARIASLTLTPERGDLGLLPIVITSFPFLVSKSAEAFSRYREENPQQLNYLSRRHAHVFVKGGELWLEDLGSTNGTFVDGKRLDEHAVSLRDGAVLAFGGHHFVYRVSVQKEAPAEPTVTCLDPAVRAQHAGPAMATAAMPVPAAGAATATAAGTVAGNAAAGAGAARVAVADPDKTTFVAAAGSFLDIFCIDQPPSAPEQSAAESGNDGGAVAAADKDARQGRARGRVAAFAAELAGAFSGGEGLRLPAGWWRWPALAGVLLAVALFSYLSGNPERSLRGMLDKGEYSQAATAADRYLERSPDEEKIRALGTEALLRAGVPGWLGQLRARQYQRADAALAQMRSMGRHNADALSLIDELDWIGRLEKFVAARGGAGMPVRDAGERAAIERLLREWDDDTAGHQQAFNSISSYVPEFRDQYAQALSHVRKLALVNGQKAAGEQSHAEQQSPQAAD